MTSEQASSRVCQAGDLVRVFKIKLAGTRLNSSPFHAIFRDEQAKLPRVFDDARIFGVVEVVGIRGRPEIKLARLHREIVEAFARGRAAAAAVTTTAATSVAAATPAGLAQGARGGGQEYSSKNGQSCHRGS